MATACFQPRNSGSRLACVGRGTRRAAAFAAVVSAVALFAPFMVGSGKANPVDLATSPVDQQVIIDSTGTITAVWARSSGGNYVIQSARYEGGSWTPAQSISSAAGIVSSLDLAVDASGAVTAVWLRAEGSANVVRASRRVGAAWTTPVALSSPSGQASGPSASAEGSGVVDVIWTLASGSGRVVQTARFDGSAWGAAADLSSVGDVDPHGLDILSLPGGNAVAVWPIADGGSVRRLQSATYLGGATNAWQAATFVSSSGLWASSARLAFEDPDAGAAGNEVVTLVWSGQIASGGLYRILARRMPVSTLTWASQTSVSSVGSAGSPSLAMLPDGTGVVVWSRYDLSEDLIQASRIAAGSWGPVVTLSDAGYDSRRPLAAMGESGSIHVVWDENVLPADPQGLYAVAGARYSGGAWTAASRFATSGEAYDPELAATLGGQVATAWIEESGAGTSARIARGWFPAAPSSPAITRLAGARASVAFTAGAANGDPITAFTATCVSSDGGATRSASDAAGPIVVPGLSTAKTYTCSVIARNGLGDSPASSSTSSFHSGYQLSVSSISGSGTVTDAAGEISCGAACSGVQLSAQVAVLTATPASGWAFSSWGGACAGASPTCSVLMSQARDVTATFVVSPSSGGTGGSGLTSTPIDVPAPTGVRWSVQDLWIVAEFANPSGSAYAISATDGAASRSGTCVTRDAWTTCRVQVTPGRWVGTITPVGASGTSLATRSLSAASVPRIVAPRWSSPTTATPLVARFPAARSTTYSMRATSGGKRPQVARGTCAVAGDDVTCSVRLRVEGKWVVTITPRSKGSFGKAVTRTVRVTA